MAARPAARAASPAKTKVPTAQPVVAVAVSGGRDSMALLHMVRNVAGHAGLQVVAMHVHHGLQPDADRWARDVQATCRRWQVACDVERLPAGPQGGDSVEAWARRERYAALTRMARARGATLVLLAHHRRDQAETFLLQALRGNGVAGLAAMPPIAMRDGLTWARPWLMQPREAIEAYVRRHRLRIAHDPSNQDPRFDRSRLRLHAWSALVQAFPQAESNLAQAAARAAEARLALVEVAADDMVRVTDAQGLRVAPWAALPPGRRRLALQAWLRSQTGQGAAHTLIARLMRELPAESASTGSASWPAHDGMLRRYRGRLTWVADGAPPSAGPKADENPHRSLSIRKVGHHPAPGGTLEVRRVKHGGVPLALLADAEWKSRPAGVQFQQAATSTARSLKKAYQSAGIPAWQRAALLLFARDRLVFVPGLGLDARVVAEPGTPRVMLIWHADS